MILCVFYYNVLSCVADVRTIADCSLQRSVCNCNKDIIIIIVCSRDICVRLAIVVSTIAMQQQIQQLQLRMHTLWWHNVYRPFYGT